MACINEKQKPIKCNAESYYKPLKKNNWRTYQDKRNAMKYKTVCQHRKHTTKGSAVPRVLAQV